MSRPRLIVVVDDNHKLIRIATRLLASIPGIKVIGEASSGEAALEAVDRLRPDIILLDLSMPGMGGLEAIRRIVDKPHAPQIIVMSTHNLPEYREAALTAGATSFISKAELALQLRPVIDGLIHSTGSEGPSPTTPTI